MTFTIPMPAICPFWTAVVAFYGVAFVAAALECRWEIARNESDPLQPHYDRNVDVFSFVLMWALSPFLLPAGAAFLVIYNLITFAFEPPPRKPEPAEPAETTIRENKALEMWQQAYAKSREEQ